MTSPEPSAPRFRGSSLQGLVFVSLLGGRALCGVCALGLLHAARLYALLSGCVQSLEGCWGSRCPDGSPDSHLRRSSNDHAASPSRIMGRTQPERSSAFGLGDHSSGTTRMRRNGCCLGDLLRCYFDYPLLALEASRSSSLKTSQLLVSRITGHLGISTYMDGNPLIGD